MINVLVVEDSPTVRQFLVHVLSSDPQLRVVGTAANGEEALHAVAAHKPDLITMDINMPVMDGLEATRRIMETHPTPIVIVSGHVPTAEAAASFRALEAGALTVLPRPAGKGHRDHDKTAKDLVRMVKLMAEVRVVKRWPHPESRLPKPAVVAPPAPLPFTAEVVAIGGSTGAPAIVETILARLPRKFALPILVVQHITPGFVDGFAQWLAQSSGWPVRVAAHGEPLLAGTVYVAPDRFHMGVQLPPRITLSEGPPEHALRPSVSFLFRSVAFSFGARAVGVLLSGMGHDGAEALKLMKDRGALTIAQDQQSSVVHSMPGEAIRLGAVSAVLPPDRIAALLGELSPPKQVGAKQPNDD